MRSQTSLNVYNFQSGKACCFCVLTMETARMKKEEGFCVGGEKGWLFDKFEPIHQIDNLLSDVDSAG